MQVTTRLHTFYMSPHNSNNILSSNEGIIPQECVQKQNRIQKTNIHLSLRKLVQFAYHYFRVFSVQS